MISEIKNKKHLGFDELSDLLGISQEAIINKWVGAGEGIKRFPFTKFSNHFKPSIGDDGFIETKGNRPVYVCIKTWICFDKYNKPLVFEKGRKTDLASIPSFLFYFIKPNESWIFWAAIIHDLRCEMKSPSKFLTDYYFMKDMIFFQSGKKMSLIVFLAVSVGNLCWWFSSNRKARIERLKNEIATWKYISDKELPKKVLVALEKELSEIS